MARIALVDVSAGTAAAVRAAASGHEVAGCRATDVPAGTALIVAELGLPESTALLAAGRTPLLLLAAEDAAVDATRLGESTRILRKPFDLIELRTQVRELLELGPAAPADPDAVNWLASPRLPAAAVRIVEAASRLGGTLWITGEPGTGCEQVAAGVARLWNARRSPVLWQQGEALEAAAARLDDAARVLWVASADQRSLAEQDALCHFLAVEPARRVVVSSGDQPDRAVLSGTLLRGLHQVLSPMALRLPPLRERGGDIAQLAYATGRRVARTAFAGARFTLRDDAVEALRTWHWPGNLVELDAVVTRSVIAYGAADLVDLDAVRLYFAPFATGPTAAESATAQAAGPRRGVVLAIQARGKLAAAEQGGPQKTGPDPVPAPSRSAAGEKKGSDPVFGVEAILAGFAHEIRNPMSTLKTFTGLMAADAAGGDETLALLAGEACERIDEQLELLQRYSELAAAPPASLSARLEDTRDSLQSDVIELLGAAIDAGGNGELVRIAARAPLWTSADAGALRLVADAVVAECRARASASGEAAVIDARAGAVEVRVPIGAGAIDRLGKWVGSAGLPWRLAIARDVAMRAGGDLEVGVEATELRLSWRFSAREEGSNDDQAGSPDRRRRGRGT